MIEERDLIRHLEEGGDQLWNPATPPPLDLAAITGVPAPERPASQATVSDDPATAAAKAPRTTSAPRRRPRWLRPGAISLPPFGLAVGALACVALGLGLGAAVFGGPGTDGPRSTVVASSPEPPEPTPTRKVALQPFADAPKTALAVASVFKQERGDSIDVRVSGLPPLAPGSFYELWALGTEGRMVSLGSIAVDENGQGETTLPLPVSLSRFPVLDISLEPADGNPAHSGGSVLRAPV
ncbi:MAG: anti-sigma factor [Solirubrobacteraceae bacterium]|nr:anti-sigma factor [Solirubrobacteraceae bacterium]